MNMKRRLSVMIMIALLASAVPASAKILLKSLPFGLVRADSFTIATGTDEDDKIALEWVQVPVTPTCRLKFALSPGSVPGDYGLGPVSESSNGKLTNFIPEDYGMTGGIYYCIIQDVAVSTNTSEEFVMYVESTEAPQKSQPENQSITEDSTPLFSWDAIQGVPYYWIFVVDTPINIDADADPPITTPDGDPITPVWQAITSETSIVYGTPDPSGFYTNNQPLIGGTTYTWTVMNCYASNPAFTSMSAFELPMKFTFSQVPNIPKPVLTSPAHSTSTVRTDDIMTFTWDTDDSEQYDDINNFHIYIYRRLGDGTEDITGSILAWDAATSNKFFDVDASAVFTSSIYDWRVIAQDARGRGIESDTWAFNYERNEGSLTVKVRYYSVATSTYEPVEMATVEITSLEAAPVEPFKYFTDGAGRFELDMSPGIYQIKASKDGFETKIATSTVVKDGSVQEVITLVKSQAYITGFVRDGLGSGVFDASVNAKETTLETEKTVMTNKDGAFRISVTTGTSWDVYAYKSGYTQSSVSNVTVLSTDTTKNMGNLTMSKNNNTLNGTTVNENGYAVSSVEVNVKKDAVSWSVLSNSQGSFSFSLGEGTWVLSASKEGFISPTPVSVAFTSNQTVTKQLVMTSQANRVTGYVSDDKHTIQDAYVSAVTLAGSIVADDTTNNYGQYTLNLPGGNTYVLMASKNGYTSPAPKQVTFLSTDTAKTNSGINFVLIPNPSSIKGTVTSDGTTPLPGVTITDGVSVASSRSDGTYTLSVNEGTYTLWAAIEGYSSALTRSVTIGVGETISGIDFLLTPNAGVIKGKVYSGSEPVYGATVIVSTSSTASEYTRTTTLQTGDYSVSLDSGTWYLTASKTGFSPSAKSQVFLAAGQISNGNDLSITQELGYIKGRVKDGSGTGLRNVSMEVKDGDTGNIVSASVTDLDGKYAFSLSPDTYTIRAEKTGYQVIESTFSINESVTIIKDITLPSRKYRITGKISDNSSTGLRDVSVSAVLVDTVTVTTDNMGLYSISVDSGTYAVKAQKKGYKVISYSTNSVTFLAADPSGLEKTSDFTMGQDYCVIKGSVTFAAVGLDGANIYANGRSTVTHSGGSYWFYNVLSDTYTVIVTTSGYQDSSQTFYTAPGSTQTKNFAMVKATFTVSGKIDDGTDWLTNVTVKVRPKSEFVYKSDLTDSGGNYSITGLVPGDYYILVSKQNYSLSVGVSSFTITDQNRTEDFTLLPDTQTIAVSVQDEDLQPLSSVTVSAIGTGSTSGYFGQGSYTETAGSYAKYTVSDLKAGTYTVRIEKTGYKSKDLFNVPTSSSVYVTLDHNHGSISGMVSRSGTGLGQVTVTMSHAAGIYADEQTVSAADGTYSIATLFPGRYLVSINKADHYSVPNSTEVVITASSTTAASITDVDFSMVYSPIKEINMTVPSGNILNTTGLTYVFALNAKDKDGRVVGFESPLWSLSPATAGTIASGVLDPSDTFIGEATVNVISGSKSVQEPIMVYYKVVSRAQSIELKDSEDMRLIIPANTGKHASMIEDNISLRKRALTSNRVKSGQLKASGKIFDFRPSGFKFSGDVSLSLPLTEGLVTENMTVGLWDMLKLKWVSLGGTVSGQHVGVDINHFSEYAILQASKGLGIEFYSITPNPFSPKVRPVTFRYSLSSMLADQLEVSIKVYNMIADSVRTITEKKLQWTGVVYEASWDGYDDEGELAMNGRYIVEFRVRDASDEKQYLKTIVLVK